MGAWPKPPHCGSKRAASAACALAASSSDGQARRAPRGAPRCCSIACATASACCSSSARRKSHAWRRPWSTRGKPGRPRASSRREVGAGEEGLAVGRQEHRVRPAARARDELGRAHVDLVDVGALLAVHLDADEALVELARDLGVGEALALHDVAPVAGRVADREEDRLVLAGARGRRPPRPTGTSRPGCPCGGAGRGSTHAPDDSPSDLPRRPRPARGPPQKARGRFRGLGVSCMYMSAGSGGRI